MSINKISALMLAACSASALHAGVTYKDGDKSVTLGGRLQLQYHTSDPSTGSSTDELIFRRLEPYIEGTLHKDYIGKFEWDMGKSKFQIKEAYLRYLGYDMFDLTVGNANFAFSRECITSSKVQSAPERTFSGDTSYGSPERQTGIHLNAKKQNKFDWGFSLAEVALVPDEKRIKFEPTIQFDRTAAWNDGIMVGGRVEFHPIGYLKPAQGDLGKTAKNWYIALGTFAWNNDNDNNKVGGHSGASQYDVDSVVAFETGIGARYLGLSADLQYNSFDSELVDNNITSGMYVNSETTLSNYALELGYMVVAKKFEVITSYQSQDADNYKDDWNKITYGFNYFIKEHDVKVQVAYTMSENKDGVIGSDVNDLYTQFQYLF